MTDAPAVRRALADADAVVHLAALVGYPACKKCPEEARRTNVQGTQNVIDRMQTRQELYDTIRYHEYEALDASLVKMVVPQGMPQRD